MKKDKILKSSLSTLLKRFSSTDIISSLSPETCVSTPSLIPTNLIKDNSILKRARISEKSLSKACQDINENGIKIPLYVINKGDYYEAVYPRVLYKAARKNKIEAIPSILIEVEDDNLLLFLASRLLKEKESNIVEMSLIFNKIKKSLKYSQKEIAQATSLSRPQVTNIMRLIKMPDYILDAVIDGEISFGHVRAISTLNEEEMKEILDRIFNEHLSVHEVEKIVYQMKHHVNFSKNEKDISDKFKCEVNSTSKKVTLSFDTVEEKEKFIDYLLKR